MRVVVWFSCGAPSAVASKLAIEKYGDQAEIVYCDTSKNERPDNMRFLVDVETWIKRKVTIIRSAKYSTIEEVFDARQYMSGNIGAPCTVELKKVPRFAFQKPDDVHIFGFTSDEELRIQEFNENNHDLNLEWILRDQKKTKAACNQMITQAGIELPLAYRLGYTNNNCIGCVKSTSPVYWNKIRRTDPEVFESRAVQSRRLGCKLVRLDGERIFLDELPEDNQLRLFNLEPEEKISCGPECAEVA